MFLPTTLVQVIFGPPLMPRYLTYPIASLKSCLRSLFITLCTSNWLNEESPLIQFYPVMVFILFFPIIIFNETLWDLLFTQGSDKIWPKCHNFSATFSY